MSRLIDKPFNKYAINLFNALQFINNLFFKIFFIQ